MRRAFFLLLPLILLGAYAQDELVPFNPLRANVSGQRLFEAGDLLTGQWVGNLKDCECSGGSPIKTNLGNTEVKHSFDDELGTYSFSKYYLDKKGDVIRKHKLGGKYSVLFDVTDEPMASISFSAEYNIVLTDENIGVQALDPPQKGLFFVDIKRSNKDTLVLGYPYPENKNPCPEGEVVILKHTRP